MPLAQVPQLHVQPLSYFIIREHSQFGALISVKPTLKGVSGLLVVGHERYNTKKGMKAIEKGLTV